MTRLALLSVAALAGCSVDQPPAEAFSQCRDRALVVDAVAWEADGFDKVVTGTTPDDGPCGALTADAATSFYAAGGRYALYFGSDGLGVGDTVHVSVSGLSMTHGGFVQPIVAVRDVAGSEGIYEAMACTVRALGSAAP